jgi:hypothetical protein
MLGALAMAGALLVSWVALSQPDFLAPSASPPVQLLSTSFSSGFAAAPEDSQGRYLLRQRRASALFSDTGMALRLPSRTAASRELGWRVAGARSVRPEVSTPGGLRYPGVLPGVDLWFAEHAEGVEYGFRAERGADLRRVTLEYAGAQAVRVVEEGRALEVALEEGVLRETGLHCAQEDASGFLRAVGCRFTDAHPVGREQWAYSIEVDVEDPDRPVVVDPVILWNAYYDLQGAEKFGDMVRGDAGELFIVGSLTPEASRSVETSLLQGVPGGSAVVVARFHEDGGLDAWTAIAGSGNSMGGAIALGNGKVYVAGVTGSSNFGSIVLNRGAENFDDGFVAQLDSTTLKADWIFLLGSDAGADVIHDVAVGPEGALFVVGATRSLNFPQAPDASTPTGWDVFATRLDPKVDAGNPADGGGFTRFNLATVRWSTVLRGTNDDQAHAVAVDETGRVYVTGSTFSANLLASPLAPFDKYQGEGDVFAVRLEPDAGRGEASLYLGGRGTDEGRALAVRPSTQSLLIGGTTKSLRTPDGGSVVAATSDAFLVDVQRMSFQPQGSLSLGGDGDEMGRALTLSNGEIYLGGTTYSPEFPVDGGFDTDFGITGVTEGFVARLVKVGGTGNPVLQWSSFVGGTGNDEVIALQGDDRGHLFIGGTTSSAELVPPWVPSPTYPGPAPEEDPGRLFVMRVDPFATAPDAGPVLDGGTGTEPDGGTDAGTPDAGTPDAGTPDAGTPDAGTPGLVSPLGWSCGTTGSSGGMGLALGTLAALVLFASRRKRATSGH